MDQTHIYKCNKIAKYYGGTYIIETNTIDCNGHQILFKNEWLNEQGTFEFKLTNFSNTCQNMFGDCVNLTHLPEDFIIPEGVINCMGMFGDCVNLTHLPENFTLPSTLKSCQYMFEKCTSLTHLPKKFTLPSNVRYADNMFEKCTSLTELPELFSLPEGIRGVGEMFSGCQSLTNIPPQFSIPMNSNYDAMFFNCFNLTNDQKRIENYLLMEI